LPNVIPTAAIERERSIWPNLLLALVLLYLFLVGITCLSGGIKELGKGVMDVYFTSDMNPVLGLLVGILATTLVQSSSVTTSLVVGLVGAGQMSVAASVPIIMGANIGTTVTATVVSLAHSNRSGEFRRAFAAATCHDAFNVLSVALFLPLEILTRSLMGRGILETASGYLADWTTGTGGAKYNSPLKASFKEGASLVKSGMEGLGFEDRNLSIALAVAGGLLILVTLAMIVKVMRGPVVSRMERYVGRVLGAGGAVAILVGIVLTVMVQSSSITTSVMVPLAGAGIVTLRQIYPITLGANIGTTVTALLASMAVSGDAAVAARQIAMVHLCFNLGGILVWFVPERTRRIPLALAEWLAEYASVSKGRTIGLVFSVFYGLPAVIFFLTEAF
jgi:sodium-dependent phosphate cotransporter